MGCTSEYGRVHLEKSPLPPLQGSENLMAPRILAFRVEPRDMYRWQELECRVQKLLRETFGSDGLPVRYYYGEVFSSWDDSWDRVNGLDVVAMWLMVSLS